MKSRTDTMGRRHRTHSCSNNKRISLQHRDWLWLQKLHQHGPLASSFLLQFSEHLGRSEKRAKERLGDLFHEDQTKHDGPYLTRPLQQFQSIDSRYNQLAYDLAPAGKRALQDNGAWSETDGSNGGPWWHKFMVSSITASIELATSQRSDLTFIPQTAILERANAGLSCAVDYLDPVSNQSTIKKLAPDALFGLEYHTNTGSKFRFFAVEADRATEPISSNSNARKSIQRNVAQYQAFIQKRAYQQHLKLTAPLLVLNVTTSKQRMRNMMEVAAKQEPTLAPALLHQFWADFATPLSVPKHNPCFLQDLWLRPDGSALRIDR